MISRRILLCLMLVFSVAISKAETFTVRFDSSKTKSGAKIALKDLNPNLPSDWTGYNYVGVEIRVSTSQRYLLGFTTSHGYDELMLHSYVPGEWNRLVIPLVYLTQLPASSHDMASMYNKPRQTGWINIGGGNYGPMTGVDSIGIRQYRPLNDAFVQIRDVQLYREDPGDEYMSKKPALDELGQSNLLDWKGKAHGLKQLRNQWKAEDQEKVSAENLYGYSQYGGYADHRLQGTGFFRKEQVDGRWWLVDPDGCQFLSVGVCCINVGSGGHVKDLDKRLSMLKELPPKKYIHTDRQGNRSAEFSPWNLVRRFGEDYLQPAMDLTFKRMDKWGVNTIGNWSQKELERAGRKAFTCTMRPAYVDGGLFGLGDPYEPDFEERLRESLRPLMAEYRDNPWLIGYYVGNEPTWVGAENRVCEALLKGRDRAMKTALQQYLQAYGDTREARSSFVYDTFDRYLAAVKRLQLQLDPNHMNLGYRFGNIYAVNERLARICAKYFDVMSFNFYAIKPDHKLMDRVLSWTNLPMIIGEFHFGAVDRGLGQSLFQVRDQMERGKAYRNYVETGFSHPGLVGVTYFTWNDEDVLGRFDGENYNCGLVDVTNVPYREQTEAMMETAKRLYRVHAGSLAPFSETHDFIVGMERGGDEW